MTSTIRNISKQIAVAASLAFSLTCGAADLSILSAGGTGSQDEVACKVGAAMFK